MSSKQQAERLYLEARRRLGVRRFALKGLVPVSYDRQEHWWAERALSGVDTATIRAISGEAIPLPALVVDDATWVPFLRTYGTSNEIGERLRAVEEALESLRDELPTLQDISDEESLIEVKDDVFRLNASAEKGEPLLDLAGRFEEVAHSFARRLRRLLETSRAIEKLLKLRGLKYEGGKVVDDQARSNPTHKLTEEVRELWSKLKDLPNHKPVRRAIVEKLESRFPTEQLDDETIKNAIKNWMNKVTL